MEYLSHEQRASRRRQIAADVSEGLTPDGAASKHGVSRAWAVSACLEHGVPTPEYHKSSVVEVVAALMNARQGDTLASIGLKVSLSRERIRQILEQCKRYDIVPQEWPREYPTSTQEVGAARR